MSLEVKGRITKILPIESGVSKSNKEWRKGGFVLDTGAQYNPEVAMSLFGDDKLDMLAAYSVGQEVTASFNVSSREFNGKYYHNIDVWKIAPISSIEGSTPPPVDSTPDEDDDLPF